MASGSSYFEKNAPEAQRFHRFLLDVHGVGSGFSFPELDQARKAYRCQAGQELRRKLSTYDYRLLLMQCKGIRRRGRREKAIYCIRPASDWTMGENQPQNADEETLKSASVEARRPKEQSHIGDTTCIDHDEVQRFHRFLVESYGCRRAISSVHITRAHEIFIKRENSHSKVYTAHQYQTYLLSNKVIQEKVEKSMTRYIILPVSSPHPEDDRAAVASSKHPVPKQPSPRKPTTTQTPLSMFSQERKPMTRKPLAPLATQLATPLATPTPASTSTMSSRERATMFKFVKSQLKRNRQRLIQNKGDIRIFSRADSGSQGQMLFELNEGEESLTKTIHIVNTSPMQAVELVDCAFLRKKPDFCLDNDFSGVATLIRPGRGHAVECTYQPSTTGVLFNNVLVFAFRNVETKLKFYTIRLVNGRCQSAVAKELEPVRTFVRMRERFSRNDETVGRKEKGRRPMLEAGRCNLPMLDQDTPKYKCDEILRHGVVDSDKPSASLQQRLRQDLEENYTDVFSSLIACEEYQMWIDIRRYDMSGVRLTRRDGIFLALQVPGLAEKRPSLLKGDKIYVTCSSLERTCQYQGFVHKIMKDEVYIQFSEGFHFKYMAGLKVNVRFTFSRLPIRLQQRAVHTVEKVPGLKCVLFPTVGTSRNECFDLCSRVRFFNRKIENNKRQKEAVLNIVSGRSRPAPYLLFGPPGTGKTVTTVETIKQVLQCIKDSRILACAPSNTAADLLCERLTNEQSGMSISKWQIVRINAASRSKDDVPEAIAEYSHSDATAHQVWEARVVICTLITSARLVTARKIKRGFFTHIFVDEAGQAVEAECLIPVAGLLDPDKTQLVLAGDPEQLGPVLRSPIAIKNGLQKSLLERLMKDQRGGPMVTKLVENYRTHPAILHLPNKIFYDNELEPKADEILREKLSQWEHLPQKGFPVIFHGVEGEEKQEGDNPSFFNPEEINCILKYVERLRDTRGACKLDLQNPEAVGVISPYRKQVIKMTELFRKRHLGHVKVGSVEEFQGQERSVIIISTVRSNPDYLSLDQEFRLGFLSNPKRFNVAITRAKCLCIVIGNPHLLSRDEYWRKFLYYVKSHNGYTGCNYEGQEKEEEEVLQALADLGLEALSTSAPQAEEGTVGVSEVQLKEEPEWRADH